MMNNVDYDQFMQENRDAVLQDAVSAINPDYCGMDRDGAITLAAAMKNCGFSKSDFADVMSRSAQDKGTFAKQWDRFRGSGKHGTATEGTIFRFALDSGWSFPDPVKFAKDHQIQLNQSGANPKESRLKNLVSWSAEIAFYCIFDSVGYTEKPKNVWEIRKREKVNAGMPDPIMIKDFADAIMQGKTFSPRIYKKIVTGKDANGRDIYDYYPILQQLFVVDIDNEKIESGQKKRIENPLEIEDALNICKKNEIMPFLVYETFSSKDHREDPDEPYKKFRLCFLFDKPLTIKNCGLLGIDAVTNFFIRLFGSAADQKTTDTARLIYGTNEKDVIRFDAILDSKKILQKALEMQINPIFAPESTDETLPDPKNGEDILQDFIEIVSGKSYEPIETGIKDLDFALEGGFIRKTLVILGAAPGMGKTAIAQWIFENMAEKGNDVVYINLEMAREQLIARSISRYAWKYYNADFSAIEILRGYNWTDENKKIISDSAEIYKSKVSKNFVYNPDGVTNHIDNIINTMYREIERCKDQGKAAPIICIDYLQIIDSGERDAIEGMKSAIMKLKDFARMNNTIVFLIMANNRASNKSGTTDLESGRDTSTIEYSGDLMLGLSYTAIEDHETYKTVMTDRKGNSRVIDTEYTLDRIRQLKKYAYENNEPIPDVCNRISLKVLKNRFGQSERRANLIFDGKHSSFNQTEYKMKRVDSAPDPEEWERIDQDQLKKL